MYFHICFSFFSNRRFKDGDIIEDQTDATLVLYGLTEADAGMYACRVTNDRGRVYSDAGKLIISSK